MAAGSSADAGDAQELSWSDGKCYEIAYEKHFPSIVKDLRVQKDVINRYLNFYLGGKSQKGLSVEDLTFAVISIMPLDENTEQFIWQPAHFKDEGALFFLTPEDKLKSDIADMTHKNARSKETRQGKREEISRTDDLDKPVNGEVVSEANVAENDTDHTDIKLKPSAKKEDVEPKEKQSIPRSSQQPSDRPNVEKNIPKLPMNVRWYYKKPSESSDLKLETKMQYGPVENSAFVISCNKLLDEWETNEKGRIVLKYFFGIVALVLMRATTKKYKHLVNTFTSSKFLSVLPFINSYLQYCAPHKRCLKNSYRTFSKRDGNIPVMFAKIVVNSLRIHDLRRPTTDADRKPNIYKLTLLAHTADYGFGLLGMLQALTPEANSDDLNKIVKATYCKETEESWERLRRFLERYVVVDSKQTTHHWAKVISNDYFKHLSCGANFELSVILAVFLELKTKSADIWQSSWATKGPKLDEFKELGRKMYTAFELGAGVSSKNNTKTRKEYKETTNNTKTRKEYKDTTNNTKTKIRHAVNSTFSDPDFFDVMFAEEESHFLYDLDFTNLDNTEDSFFDFGFDGF